MLSYILLPLGIAITYVSIYKSTSVYEGIKYLPITLCLIISVVLFGLCFYFNMKDFRLLKAHLEKNTMELYKWSNVFYFVTVFVTLLVYIIFRQLENNRVITNSNIAYIVPLIISALFTMVAIPFSRVATDKILRIIYRKKFEENNKKLQEIKTDKQKTQEMDRSEYERKLKADGE
jgi:uncharacterized protein YacL